MKLSAYFALWACKLSRRLLRLSHHGGTNLPGKLAVKLCPELLGELTRGMDILAVSGTNGKTTSSRMIEQAFENEGRNYFSNRSGANLLTGITAEFAAHSNWLGRPKCDCAVIECDEAAAKKAFALLKPRVIVLTNVFRDQLDRYGEVTHTLENLKIAVEGAPEAVLCLNADCSLTSSIAQQVKNPVVFYGVDVPIYTHETAEVSDAKYCIHCKTEYEYSYTTYGHLGGYFCPKCGYHRPVPDISVSEILERTANSSTIALNFRGERRIATVNLPAAYNIYNAVGSAAALTAFGFSEDAAVYALETCHCGFGRMESFQLGACAARMILVKNPAGCNQVLSFLEDMQEPQLFVVCLNDRLADGTDVSWIWDVEFERLTALGDRLTGVLVSGDRADDMKLRLKYAGIPSEKLRVIRDYGALADALAAQDGPAVIMPTYTAMMELRPVLAKACGSGEFWE